MRGGGGGFRKQLFIGNDYAPESGGSKEPCMGSHFERQVLPRKIPRPRWNRPSCLCSSLVLSDTRGMLC